MRKLVTLFTLLAATATFAEELNADKILTALSFGVSAETIVAKINDPANTVAAVTAEDLARLRTAGVPDPVIQALVARAPQPTPTPLPFLPDDQRLIKLVRVVKDGVSEPVLTEGIRASGEVFALSLNDLIYLRQNGVPESIVTMLQATASGTVAPAKAGQPAAAGAAPKVDKDTTIEGLVIKRSTFMKKNTQGTLTFKGDEIIWNDARKPAESFTVKASALEKAYVRCRPLPAGDFCYELGFSIFKGGDYAFLDTGEEKGSNDNIMKLRELIAARFPNLVFEEKIK